VAEIVSLLLTQTGIKEATSFPVSGAAAGQNLIRHFRQVENASSFETVTGKGKLTKSTSRSLKEKSRSRKRVVTSFSVCGINS
jgi:hypothetical protein